MIFQAIRAVLGDLFEGVAQFLVGERIAVVKQVAEVVQYLLDGFYVAFVAVDEELIAAGADVHIEQRFEVFDVLILYAKERVEALGRKFQFSEIAQFINYKCRCGLSTKRLLNGNLRVNIFTSVYKRRCESPHGVRAPMAARVREHAKATVILNSPVPLKSGWSGCPYFVRASASALSPYSRAGY